MLQKLIQFNPGSKPLIFLMDAMGAFLSTVLIAGLLIPYQLYIGLSPQILYTLAGIAALLCIYSTSCYLFVTAKPKFFLSILIITNFLYTCFTIILLFIHYQPLTTLGLIYFIGESLVLAGVIWLEVKALKNWG